MIQNKRDFQKVISAIRKEMGGGEYPKAMCTGQQMEKRTATVNCGGEWYSSKSAETAQQVMENMKFVLDDYSPMENYDRTISRSVARYSAKVAPELIGDDKVYQIYRR